MKIVILMTSYRQFRELDLIPEFFKNHHYLQKHASILYRTNNPDIPVSLIEEKLAKVPCQSFSVQFSSKNVGYLYGNFEAIADSYDTLLEQQPDWVIKIHPDIFIVDESPLIETLKQATEMGAALVASKIFGHNTPALSSDFLAFSPQKLPRSVFEIYQPFKNGAERLGEEYLLFFEIKRQGIPHFIAPRFPAGRYHRDIDELGLWHEHNLERVELYLKKPASRWRTTAFRCTRFPLSTAKAVGHWLNWRFRNGEKISLTEALTVV